MNKKDPLPPISILRFKKGDLIQKQGDYSSALYRVLSGEVLLFFEDGEVEIEKGRLWPGDILGEPPFLGQLCSPHNVSARAMQNTELEIWHNQRILSEYHEMSPALRYILRQPIRRYNRTMKLIHHLQDKHKLKKAPVKKRTDWSAQNRQHYRKDINQSCFYRPVGGPEKLRLVGKVKDLSRGGLALEINKANCLESPHDAGSEFDFDLPLPNGSKIQFRAKIVHAKNGTRQSCQMLGMAITQIGYNSQKALGFFLMP